MGFLNFILCATAPPIPPPHAYRIAFALIIVVIFLNILNGILLRQKIFKINERLTKESEQLKKDIQNLKCRLRKYEEECSDE